MHYGFVCGLERRLISHWKVPMHPRAWEPKHYFTLQLNEIWDQNNSIQAKVLLHYSVMNHHLCNAGDYVQSLCSQAVSFPGSPPPVEDQHDCHTDAVSSPTGQRTTAEPQHGNSYIPKIRWIPVWGSLSWEACKGAQEMIQSEKPCTGAEGPEIYQKNTHYKPRRW